MTIESAATFLVASILIGLGSIIIALVILLINQLYTRYWTPVKWLNFIDIPAPLEPQNPPSVAKKQQVSGH